MPYNEANYVYDPLERRTFEAIAYNAIGRGSETNTYPAYRLTHSSGQSGWSCGFMQWDFGQRGRGHKVPELLASYQRWADPADRFSAEEVESLTRRLQTAGQKGNALSDAERTRLDAYLRSDTGRAFVNTLDSEQIAYKWNNVGRPLSEITWLQRLREVDPEQAAEIVAMTAKRFNQGEARGREMIRHLQHEETNANELAAWVDTVSARAPANRAALLSGRDNALVAVRLLNDLETGDGPVSRAWREEVHARGNVGLSQRFNSDPDVQLLDAMMRNPVAGGSILHVIEDGARPGRVVIKGINAVASEEMARVELTGVGELTVHVPSGRRSIFGDNGWSTPSLPNAEPLRSNRPASLPPEVNPDPTDVPRSQFGPLRPLGAGPVLRDPLLDQARDGVRNLDQSMGRAYDDASERMAHSLAVLAKQNGFDRVDHVLLSIEGPNTRAGQNVFVVQGDPSDPAKRRAHMATSDAITMPVEQSLARLQALPDATVSSQVQSQAENLQQRQVRSQTV